MVRPTEDAVARRTARATRRRIVVMGAAGRDFHNFLCRYRNDPGSEVVAFTAAQIPGIAGRRFPAGLAGPLYPEGIPIIDEEFLEELLQRHAIDEAVFSYSDVSHAEVMHAASRVLACGASFSLPGPRDTMLESARPVIAVSAVRTGCGKSQVARWLAGVAREYGVRVAVIRHPMPYGDLLAQKVQRFARRADLDAAHCTVEEREEYEPHLERGAAVYAGVDYGAVLKRAARDCDLVLWDGGNNDFPFVRPDLHIVLVDALRPGHESAWHPGEAVLRMADVVVAAKSDVAPPGALEAIAASLERINRAAPLILGGSPVRLDPPADLCGKRVLVIEDGPTMTHGGMPHGAGWLAADRAGAVIVDPRPWAGPQLRAAYARYPHIGPVMPALGYTPAQVEEMRALVEASAVDGVVCGTPADLATLLGTAKPVWRARYDYAELDRPGLRGVVIDFLRSRELIPR
jgi:predicted GTPase